MPTQMGYIDLTATNSVMLAAEAGWSSDLEDYATKADLTVSANTIKSEVSETYATKTEVRRTDTGSGTVVTSDDAANLPLLSLAIHGKSVQDGTPSPSSPVEIESVEGRNLYDLNGNLGSTNKCTYTVDGDEVVMSATGIDGFIGNVSSSAGATWSAAYGLLMPVVGGESYALYLGNPFFNKNYITWWSAEKTSISFNYWNDSIMSFKAPDTAAYASLRFGSVSTVASTEYRTTVYFGHGAVPEHYAHQPYGAISIATVGKNVARLLPSALVTESDGVFSATGAALNAIYANNGVSYIVRAADGGYFPESTTLSFDAYTDGNASTSGNGLLVAARNSSNAIVKYMVQAPNSTSAWTKFSADLSGVEHATEIIISYMSAGGNVWHIRNFCIRTDGSTEYVPFDGSATYIPLQGHALRSLPDGTEDTLAIDSEGNATLTKRIGITTTAATDGISATVGTDAMSTTGTLADGATVIYKLATPQTISLGTIDLPSLPSPSFSLHVDAAVTPTVDAEWWTQGGEEVGSVYQRTSALEQDAEGLSVRMGGLETDAVRKSKDEWTAWLDVGTDSGNNPFLAMGQSGNDLNSRLSNESMGFYNGTEELMKLSGADGVKADTVRTKRVYIGSWILEELDSGDMAIKLVGGGA